MEDQLFQAKRALEDRAKAARRLEGRLAKTDSELNRYRERYGNLDRQNKSKRLSEKSRSSRSRSLSPGGREKQSEQVCSFRFSRCSKTCQNKHKGKVIFLWRGGGGGGGGGGGDRREFKIFLPNLKYQLKNKYPPLAKTLQNDTTIQLSHMSCVTRV
jgi:hypothetical protein